MDRKRALVVGASGLLGGNLLAYLASLPDWQPISLSRHAPADGGAARHVAVDLLDRDRCAEKLKSLEEVTHVFYCARAVETDYVIRVGPNVDMLRNLLDALEPVAPRLTHVQLMHGMKWYGSDRGPYRVPAKESHPRAASGSFYYEQHDLMSGRQAGKRWSWSTLRPHFICGVAVGSPSNLMSAIGALAAILKAIGEPLWFPGPQASFDAMLMYTDVRLLTKAMVWAATDPRCANNAFNIANGDYFRWRDVWPGIAANFGMEAGGVRPLKLQEFMADKEPVWDALVERHGLKPARLAEVADWAFADSVFRLAWDQTMSVVKAHQFGFREMLDSEAMLQNIFAAYRKLRILP